MEQSGNAALSLGQEPSGAAIRNAMTVDVEDYFQVQAFASSIRRETWDLFERRVEANTDRMLDQFDRAGVKATFFTMGWVAERHPRLIRRIVAAGHELASHGYDHTRADTQSAARFTLDVRRAKRLLEDIGSTEILGYRAPTFSIDANTPWAHAVLASEGYRYSSSINPVAHDQYGAPDAPRAPFRPDDLDIWELPMSTLRLFDRNLPCSGGGYFRLLPYALFRKVLAEANRAEGRPAIFYTHPWEIDPGQPRIRKCPLSSRLRHYANLSKTAPRLERLLRDFSWSRVDQVFADLLAAPAQGRPTGSHTGSHTGSQTCLQSA